MALVTTPAVVLRTYPYSETSKIVRLATRDLGVQSAIAKGVLRPKSRFAAGVGLLGGGVGQLCPRGARCAAEVRPVRGGGRAASSPAGGGVRWRGCAPPPPAPPPRLPAQAHRDLVALNDRHAPLPVLAPPHAAAHRRLLARFVRHHFGETSNLPALDFWERHAWSSPLPSAIPAPAPAPAPPPPPPPPAPPPPAP